MAFFKKTNPRRSQVRRDIMAERLSKIGQLANTKVISSVLLLVGFVFLCTVILSFELIQQSNYRRIVPISIVVVLMSLAAAFYIYFYQRRIIENRTRMMTMAGLFIVLLAVTRIGVLSSSQPAWGTATAVIAAIVLTIAYDQRFATGMSMFYCVFASFALGSLTTINMFLTMATGSFVCCFSLREIRTRMKLLEVGAVTSVLVFLTSMSLGFLAENPQAGIIFEGAGLHAMAAFVAGLLIQSLLPVIERVFRIATSMTLLDYSDANQPLLKRLAMEAPGTFSHVLLVGSVAETAAESINRNGLLCRVGAYYHDIGKINKPSYFVENQMGSASRHKELSPAMSQLVIVGHVKDGIEMAKEYGLPAVLRQFIDTHHGTTVVEYFYHEAKKQTEDDKSGKSGVISEDEFRYPGPKPRSKEAAIVMLADSVEGAVRSLGEVTPTKIETVVHNMAVKRLQDGQFDECDMSLRELSQIEASISKSLAAHHHGRIAYPQPLDEPEEIITNNS